LVNDGVYAVIENEKVEKFNVAQGPKQNAEIKCRKNLELIKRQ